MAATQLSVVCFPQFFFIVRVQSCSSFPPLPSSTLMSLRLFLLSRNLTTTNQNNIRERANAAGNSFSPQPKVLPMSLSGLRATQFRQISIFNNCAFMFHSSNRSPISVESCMYLLQPSKNEQTKNVSLVMLSFHKIFHDKPIFDVFR